MKYNDNTPEYTRFLYLTEKDPYAILEPNHFVRTAQKAPCVGK